MTLLAERHLQQQGQGLVIGGSDDERRLYREVAWRIVPFFFACCVLNYIDRVMSALPSCPCRICLQKGEHGHHLNRK